MHASSSSSSEVPLADTRDFAKPTMLAIYFMAFLIFYSSSPLFRRREFPSTETDPLWTLETSLQTYTLCEWRQLGLRTQRREGNMQSTTPSVRYSYLYFYTPESPPGSALKIIIVQNKAEYFCGKTSRKMRQIVALQHKKTRPGLCARSVVFGRSAGLDAVRKAPTTNRILSS
jgi:hypothetical protein